MKVVVAVVLASAAAALPSAASASFPGRNGQVLFGRGLLVPTEIHVMNPSGSGRKRLIDGGRAGVGEAAWSPDGMAIAYTRLVSLDVEGASFRAAIHTAKADGTQRRRLTAVGTVSSPSWAPDGTRIAFRRGTRGGIHVMNADGSGQRRLSRGPDLLPEWSPDGLRILFVRNQALYVMDADGSGQRRLTPRSLSVTSADWAPDGTKVAIGAEGRIYTANADGSGRARLRGPAGLDLMPVWSPDGEQILFTRLSLSLRTDIYVVPSKGGRPRRLTRDGRSTATDWQPLAALVP